MTSPSSLPTDSSPSSSSPSLPSGPFSRLPTELVQLIIESTVPLSYHSTTYIERQTTLRSLCLVSRLFRQTAQPLLLNMLRFGTDQDIVTFRSIADDQTRLGTTREVVFQSTESGSFSSEVLCRLLSFLQYTKTLTISIHDLTIDISLLAGLSNLTTLRLAHVNLSSPISSVLPQLKVLQLMSVQSNFRLHQLFNPSTLPALLVFALYSPPDGVSDNDTLLTALVNQLDCLSLDQDLIETLSPEVCTRILGKTLLDNTVGTYKPTLDHCHLRLYESDGYSRSDVSLQELKRLVQNLSTCALRAVPSTLYLDLASKLLDDPELSIEHDKVSQVCKERNIELVFEDQADFLAVDSGVSMDFWRRTKEAKSKVGNA